MSTTDMDFTLTLNQQTVAVNALPVERLSAVLRNKLGMTATKVGCDAGDCGACTVLIDGAASCACLTAIAQVDGCRIETVEGLANDNTLSRLQESFLQHGAAQCGICTPGMLMTAKALLDENPHPDRSEVEDALGGVLCRCTGYQKIIDAVVGVGCAQPPAEQTPSPQPLSLIGRGAKEDRHLLLHALREGEEAFVMSDSERDRKAVGTPIRHLDGIPKVTGELTFGADVIPDNALAVRVIRSPHHFARFTPGDYAEYIAAHPGVETVLDASDIPGSNCFGVIPPFADQPVFAEGIARYRGEAIAAVVGDPAVLQQLDGVDFPVEWEVLEHSLLPQDAQHESAALIHEQRAGNILTGGFVKRGDAEAALDKAQYMVTVNTTTPFIEHAYIEPEAGYCVRKGERLEIYGCTQAPHMDREALAEIMGLAQETIRVKPSACGGGFGSKLDISFQPYLALAAWKLNKPVFLSYSRGESMRSTTKRHPSDITLTLGCDESGLISGFAFDGTFNTGAYASWGPTVANRVPVHASGPYYIADYRANSTAVHTNTSPSGAFRGFGVPQSAIAQETAFDQLADKAGVDRLEFRINNALRNGRPTVTGQVFEKGVGIVECLEALKPAWEQAQQTAASFNQEQLSQQRPLRRGVGLGSCWYGCGNTSLPNPSTVRMGITPDGRIVLHQGAMDIGQGANTVITQIAADALGVPVHAIELVGSDTDLTPDCGKTSASRQTYVTGMAAKLAGEALRTLLDGLGGNV
ncbi:MAG: molybdopterin-dependent oxidoreductase, partial [Thiolinea sp.]